MHIAHISNHDDNDFLSVSNICLFFADSSSQQFFTDYSEINAMSITSELQDNVLQHSVNDYESIIMNDLWLSISISSIIKAILNSMSNDITLTDHERTDSRSQDNLSTEKNSNVWLLFQIDWTKLTEMKQT